MEIRDLNESLRRFAKERESEQFHSIRNLLLALVGEVGELAESVQWLGEIDRKDFSKSLTPEMKARMKSGKLEWMDLVDVFEVFYMEYRQKQGWILKRGNYLSNSTDDRFKVTWEVDDQLIQGEYTFDRRWWIVTETIKTKKNT